MNKKTFGIGLLTLSLGAVMIAPTADAFWGGRGGEGMNQERFEEMKSFIQSFDSAETFQEAMKAKREERKAERGAMKEKISHEVVKTDDGVIISVTSDDAEVVAKIKERHANKEERGHGAEDITRTVVKIENGLQITMTTTDEERLDKMHERADNGWEKMGHKKGGKGEGKRKGHGKRFGGEE